MAEKLLELDPNKVLLSAKIILAEKGALPSTCPKPDCLSLDRVTATTDQITVILNADPPELSTTRAWMLYERPSVCKDHCGISGHKDRCFEIRQSFASGDILSAAGVWKSRTN